MHIYNYKLLSVAGPGFDVRGAWSVELTTRCTLSCAPPGSASDYSTQNNWRLITDIRKEIVRNRFWFSFSNVKNAYVLVEWCIEKHVHHCIHLYSICCNHTSKFLLCDAEECLSYLVT